MRGWIRLTLAILLWWSSTVFAQCTDGNTTITKHFSGGAFGLCQVVEKGVFRLTITPEDLKINPSAWYAMHIAQQRLSEIQVELFYPTGKHRYAPKFSINQRSWFLLDDKDVAVTEDKQRATMTFIPPSNRIYLAAQPLIDMAFYDTWRKGLPDFVTQIEIGRSHLNQPIYGLSTDTYKPVVLIIGRQHPPEITGAMALLSFLETVMGDSELAVAFREQFNVVMVPLVNPDGVALGHWRHNLDGVDLNRDWGKFTQPETQAVKTFVEGHLSDAPLHLMLDFHSTHRSLFYTQPENMPISLPSFTRDWLAAINDGSVPITFDDVPGYTKHRGTTKSYYFTEYGVPAITVELGDNETASDIQSTAPHMARTMMELLLTQ